MTLADQAARDRIERSLDETLFVEAGAGTGKTHQLVQRIVNLIASGAVQASQIAAITFTEKAAAELYDRVLEELDQQRAAGGQPELFAEAVEQLDHAAIETLHAFAGRILRLNPIAAGLPPGFQIADESEASLRFTERWAEALDEMLGDAQLAEPLLTVFDAGAQLADLEELARALHEDWDRAERPEAEMDPGAPAAIAPFIAELRSVIGQRHRCLDESDKLYQRLRNLEPFLEQLQAYRDEPGVLAQLLLYSAATSLKATRIGRPAAWPPGEMGAIREALRTLDEQRTELRAQIVLNCAAPIFNALRRFVLRYADERRRSGALEFHDLLIRASRLLEANESVAAALGERFPRLLIDEFQDNDPLQTRIIDAITRGQPGRAFFVGDPKQSIYRFRRADIQQFNAVKQAQRAGLTRLTQNFRSTPGVTEFVNAVFQPLMQAGGADQAEWDDLHAHRTAPAEGEYAVTVIGGQRAGAAAAVRVTEAEALARMIADVTASRWQVYDKPQERYRDARFADTAVLVPTRTGLRQLLPALEARDIPYRLESRSLVYDTREVRDLLKLLEAIDDPTHQIALVAALRSPAFACADDDLYRWRQAGGRWDYRAPPPRGVPSDDPVAEALAWLRETAARRWELSVSALVGLMIRERRLLELAVVERQPRVHWGRYRFLHDQARAYCDGGGATLNGFIEWAAQQAAAETSVIESVVPEEDHDAVRIMTIHAAKGLEFPIVVFTGLNVSRRNLAPRLLWDEDGAAQLRLRKDLETPGFAELWEWERKLQQDEYVRRNYVGATRARDHLILSLYRPVRGRSDAGLIDEVLLDVTAPYRRLTDAELPDPPPPPQAVGEEVANQTWADREHWIAEREAASRRLGALPRESATGVAKRAVREPPEPGATPNYEPDDELPPWRRGRAGTAIGRATHGVLQVIELQRPDEVEIRDTARAQAAAESLTGPAAATVERLARRAVDSAIVREAVRADRYWRELYAAVEIEGVLLDGFIDLLYEQPNGKLVVVDYKTDALRPGEAVDAAVERYRLQAASYALILEESLQREVERCVLFFLEPDEAREIPELAQAVGEVRELLAAQSGE